MPLNWTVRILSMRELSAQELSEEDEDDLDEPLDLDLDSIPVDRGKIQEGWSSKDEETRLYFHPF